VLVLTISANGELVLPEEDADEVEVLEPARLPVVAPVEDPPEVEVLDVVDADAAPVDPAETVSPGERLASEAIVPLVGAYSFVPSSAA
jgi:hypothetical protein